MSKDKPLTNAQIYVLRWIGSAKHTRFMIRGDGTRGDRIETIGLERHPKSVRSLPRLFRDGYVEIKYKDQEISSTRYYDVQLTDKGREGAKTEIKL